MAAAVPGTLIGSGRNADVYDVGDGRVLRRYPLPPVRARAARALQGAFTRSFLRAAGPLDESWRAAAIRMRLTDQNLLPDEVARLRKLLAAP